jgi:hypothetical protein
MFSGVHMLIETVEWIVIAGAVIMVLKFAVGSVAKKKPVPVGGVAVLPVVPPQSHFDRLRERVSAPLIARPVEPIGAAELAKGYGSEDLGEALYLRLRADDTDRRIATVRTKAAELHTAARADALNLFLSEVTKPLSEVPTKP